MQRLCTVILSTRQVGSDRSNRNGTGVNIDEVHALGSDIKGVGWSDSEPDPLCIVRKPGDTSLCHAKRCHVPENRKESSR